MIYGYHAHQYSYIIMHYSSIEVATHDLAISSFFVNLFTYIASYFTSMYLTKALYFVTNVAS